MQKKIGMKIVYILKALVIDGIVSPKMPIAFSLGPAGVTLDGKKKRKKTEIFPECG